MAVMKFRLPSTQNIKCLCKKKYILLSRTSTQCVWDSLGLNPLLVGTEQSAVPTALLVVQDDAGPSFLGDDDKAVRISVQMPAADVVARWRFISSRAGTFMNASD